MASESDAMRTASSPAPQLNLAARAGVGLRHPHVQHFLEARPPAGLSWAGGSGAATGPDAGTVVMR